MRYSVLPHERQTKRITGTKTQRAREEEWSTEVRGRVTVSLISGLQAMFSYTAECLCVYFPVAVRLTALGITQLSTDYSNIRA